jgi:hypothetical protein
MADDAPKSPDAPGDGRGPRSFKPAGPLTGWATVMALALTGLAALGFIWLREGRSAARERPPAGELLLRLDLNSASAEQLDLLPGVGAPRARKIVEAREARKGFKRLAELDEVLGPGSAERLAPYLMPLPGDRP